MKSFKIKTVKLCALKYGEFWFTRFRLRKIINIKKIVRFTMRKSVIHDFLALKQNSLFTRFSVYMALSGNVTPRIKPFHTNGHARRALPAV